MAVRRNVPEASDYMDDEPRPNKRRYDEDEDDESRPRKARRNRYDDDDEDDERPTKTRRVEDDEEEEDPDELPERSSVIQKGWAAARKAAASASEFTDEFRFDDEGQVVKFLEPEPVVFQQHWINERQGKKSFVCLGDECPLCEELGHSPSYRFAFSIVNLSQEGMPRQALYAGVRLATALDKHGQNERTGPLDKQFWTLSRTGEGRNTQHHVQLVKARDLADDWDIDPDDVDAVLEKSKPLDLTKEIRQNTRAELREIVKELL